MEENLESQWYTGLLGQVVDRRRLHLHAWVEGYLLRLDEKSSAKLCNCITARRAQLPELGEDFRSVHTMQLYVGHESLQRFEFESPVEDSRLDVVHCVACIPSSFRLHPYRVSHARYL